MNKTQLFLILLMSTCFGFAARAEVEQLQGGSCWLERHNPLEIKAASFGDGRSYAFRYDLLDEFMQSLPDVLQDQNIDVQDYDFFVFCNSHHLTSWIMVRSEQGSYCLKIEGSKTTISLNKVFGQHPEHKKECVPYELGKLVIGIRGGVERLNQLLGTSLKDFGVKSAKNLAGSQVMLELDESHFWKESQVGKELDKALSGELMYFEILQHVDGAGEWHLIN